MKVFDLKNNQLIIEPQVLTVPEFLCLWERDKTKHKDVAFKDLSYVYHMSDFNSPYSSYPEDKKEEVIKQDIYKNPKFKADKDLLKACSKYRDLSSTPKQRFFNAAMNKLDEITKFITETQVDESTIKAVLEIYKNLSTTISSSDRLEEAINKESEKSTSKTRGNYTPGMFEN